MARGPFKEVSCESPACFGPQTFDAKFKIAVGGRGGPPSLPAPSDPQEAAGHVQFVMPQRLEHHCPVSVTGPAQQLRVKRRTQKSPAHAPPKASCAGEGALVALIFRPSLAIRSRIYYRLLLTRRCGPCARRLRTRAPVTKPLIDRPTGGELEALSAVLKWRPIKDIGMDCRHEGSERGQSRYRHDKLTH
jgi:hypothetical protein